MTEEQMQNTMQFIVEQQAQFAAHMEELKGTLQQDGRKDTDAYRCPPLAGAYY